MICRGDLDLAASRAAPLADSATSAAATGADLQKPRARRPQLHDAIELSAR
jgi:hypothetical protein